MFSALQGRADKSGSRYERLTTTQMPVESLIGILRTDLDTAAVGPHVPRRFCCVIAPLLLINNSQNTLPFPPCKTYARVLSTAAPKLLQDVWRTTLWKLLVESSFS